MPNWVYTSMSVSGKREDLLAFAEKAKRPHTSLWLTEQWVYDEKLGKRVEVPEEQRKIEPKEETPDAISFWNFLAPSEEELPYYFGHLKEQKPEGYEEWTSEQQMAHDLKFTGSGWYDWNVRNWGTKWDASSDCLNTDLDELDDNLNNTISYSFETAWSPAEGAFRAMVAQHPELSFEFYNEEEQGWGVVFEGEDGELTTTKEWDIPESHADHIDIGRECVCSWDGDEENWYEDCPDLKKQFTVVVSRTYTITANNAETAWELAQEKLLNGEDNLPDGVELMDEDTAFVKDPTTNQRIYPTTVEDEDNGKQPKTCQHKFVPVSTVKDGEIVDAGYTQCVFCAEHLAHPIENGVEV